MPHIANKIDAKDKTLAEVLRGQRYTVESFQREYRWQRENIEALISDLSISFLKNYKTGDTIADYDSYDCYYMGPIVLCDEKKELSIVDGQQRLTSFTLLLLFLKHAQSKFSLENTDLKDLRDYLYVTKGGKTTLILNVQNRVKILEHLYNTPDLIFENDEFINILEEEGSPKNIQDESVDNIKARFEDITKYFPSEINTLETLPIFIEWLLEKVVMVEVKAYSLENAFTIFETMNDRGLSLNSTEILKGILLSKIKDEVKSEEMNKFWKVRIAEIKSTTGTDKDLDFFRAWLRAKFADTIRPKQQGSTNEDFELIGTQFHSWVKNNPSKVFLNGSDDYYFFIRTDFDFFSNIYIEIYETKNDIYEGFEFIYASNFYPIADSLTYPLMMAPLSVIDDKETVYNKIKLVGKFIDIFTITRVLQSKAITQSTLRYSIYDIVKSIRNLDLIKLGDFLNNEINKNVDLKFSAFHRMDNWGFYHYLFARLLYKINPSEDFSQLLRSKKQSSYVLIKIFNEEDKPNDIENFSWDVHSNAVAGHCLVRRYDLESIYKLKGIDRIKFLLGKGYMPEIIDNDDNDIILFIANRHYILKGLIDELIKF